MNRRHALSALATVVAGIMSTSNYACAGTTKAGSHLPGIFRRNTFQLPDFIKNTRSAAEVGWRYLSLFGANRQITGWQKELQGRASGEKQRELYSLINHKIREDYVLGRTTVFEGWVLSNSELHICAAIALIVEYES